MTIEELKRLRLAQNEAETFDAAAAVVARYEIALEDVAPVLIGAMEFVEFTPLLGKRADDMSEEEVRDRLRYLENRARSIAAKFKAIENRRPQ